MIVHGIVFDDLLVSSIVPIPKGKNINCSVSVNYRGIALSSILGKLFDRIVLNRYADKLITSQYQFGFKKISLNGNVYHGSEGNDNVNVNVNRGFL